MFAGIEGTGTQFHCAVGTGPGDVRARRSFPATSPEETLARVTGYLRAEQARQGRLAGVGFACFGPLDLRRGRLTSPLKPGWQQVDLAGAVRRELDVPVVVETDVNAAAVAEQLAGAGRGREQLLFVTLGTGTGIGAGALVAGRPVHGRTHPEMGHLPVARHPADHFPGSCPYHGDCLEGLAASAALAQRWGMPVEKLVTMAEPAVALEAWYLAQLATAVTYLFSPELVVFDGAVARVPGMLPAVRAETAARIGDDPAARRVTGRIDSYLTLSVLDGRAALLGALALGRRAAARPEPGPDGVR